MLLLLSMQAVEERRDTATKQDSKPGRKNPETSSTVGWKQSARLAQDKQRQ